MENVVRYLDNLSLCCDDLIEEQDIELKSVPFTVLGLPATIGLLSTLISGIGTGLFAGI